MIAFVSFHLVLSNNNQETMILGANPILFKHTIKYWIIKLSIVHLYTTPNPRACSNRVGHVPPCKKSWINKIFKLKMSLEIPSPNNS